MKRTHLLMLTLILMIVGIVSCGKNGHVKDVVDKIQSGQTLTMPDYAVMIKYVGDFAEEAQPIQDRIDNAEGASPKADVEAMKQLKARYPEADLFRKAIRTASVSELGPDNVALISHYAGYQWFSAPAGISVNPDPMVAGEIVETPPGGDSDGVIAGSVEEQQSR